MEKIIVASTNPVKIAATHAGFAQMFPEHAYDIQGVAIPSGVADQPHGDEETFHGAFNRALGAGETHADAHYTIGIEGGIMERDGDIEVFAWVVARMRDGRYGRARTGTFILPPHVAALVRDGKELGDAADIIFGAQGSKHSSGTVGLLTGNIIDRTAYYTPAVILALIPLKNSELYTGSVGEEKRLRAVA